MPGDAAAGGVAPAWVGPAHWGAIALGVVLVIMTRRARSRGVLLLGPLPAGALPDTRGPLYVAALAYIVAYAGAAVLIQWLASRGLRGFENAVVQTVHLGFALVLLRYARRGTRTVSLGAGGLVVAGVLSGFVAYAAAHLVAFAITRPYEWMGLKLPQQPITELAQRATGLGAVSVWLFAVVVAPFAEEVFYRGIVFPSIARTVSLRTALLGQAAVFGAMHVIQAPALWPLAFPLAAVGWCAGYIYLRTGSLAAPILLHAAFNAMNLVVMRA